MLWGEPCLVLRVVVVAGDVEHHEPLRAAALACECLSRVVTLFP